MNKDYQQAIEQAKENFTDLMARGNNAVGDDWEDVRKELFTPEELAESDMRVSVISELIKARQERGINQKQFEEFIGTVENIQNLLASSGKQLTVVSI